MIKAGILGGGQLGRMLLQAAGNYPVITYVLENDEHCPAAGLCQHFIKGEITNYQDVYDFGKKVDVLTIEIENVNIDALEILEKEGLTIYPKPAALRIIHSKILQKEFYKEIDVPSPEFVTTSTRSDLNTKLNFFPAVHKLATGGYDGKGVVVIKTPGDIEKGFDQPSVLEKMVEIKNELAVIVAINEKGETALYNTVEMVFNQELNLLSHQLTPAQVSDKVIWRTEAIALKLVKALKSPGIFAIEFFTDANENVWVNETAPRVHNSGHHTIEACYSSQYDMLLRIMLGYPLGNPALIMNAAIVNLIGEKDNTGTADYNGLHEVLEMDNVFVHIYGKAMTKPGRKMGHATILSNEKQELIHKVNQIKNTLKVTAVNQ